MRPSACDVLDQHVLESTLHGEAQRRLTERLAGLPFLAFAQSAGARASCRAISRHRPNATFFCVSRRFASHAIIRMTFFIAREAQGRSHEPPWYDLRLISLAVSVSDVGATNGEWNKSTAAAVCTVVSRN